MGSTISGSGTPTDTCRRPRAHKDTKGLPARDNPELAIEVLEELTRLKWFLWHGNVFRALQTVDDLQIDLDVAREKLR
ncbi:MAG: hypothetical protein ACR2IK_20750 [Chloroflexota bacterium]